jgi:hypothetical protein
MTFKNDIQAYVLLAHTRSARGNRFERELRESVQAHAQHIQLEQEAQKQHETAGLKLSAHVQHVHELLSSREVMHMDAVLSLRAQREFLDEAKKTAHLQCLNAAQEVVESEKRCHEMRHRIAINDERVRALRTQIQTLQVSQSQMAENSDEEELQDAHAAAHAYRQKEVSP